MVWPNFFFIVRIEFRDLENICLDRKNINFQNLIFFYYIKFVSWIRVETSEKFSASGKNIKYYTPKIIYANFGRVLKKCATQTFSYPPSIWMTWAIQWVSTFICSIKFLLSNGSSTHAGCILQICFCSIELDLETIFRYNTSSYHI